MPTQFIDDDQCVAGGDISIVGSTRASISFGNVLHTHQSQPSERIVHWAVGVEFIVGSRTRLENAVPVHRR